MFPEGGDSRRENTPHFVFDLVASDAAAPMSKWKFLSKKKTYYHLYLYSFIG
jgi:hypothetical protein